MKIRKLLTRALLSALLILCLIPACRAEETGGPAVSFGTFSGAKPVNASLSPDGAFGAPWYYEGTTLPEGIEGGGVWEELILLSPDGYGEERITAASVDFVSGDEALRDALSLLTDGGPVFLTDLNASPSVGEAVFRVRAESENLYAETEFTLRKLSWEEYPLFVFRRQDRSAEVALGSGDALLRFCLGIQKASPVDSFVIPEAWEMPGYTDKVVMAAGAFVNGASIELSADGPMREPYLAYVQGGLTYESGRLGILLAAEELIQ